MPTLAEATETLWRAYDAPLCEARPVGGGRPVAVFLAGDGGLETARAVHFLTGWKLLLPEAFVRFLHAGRHATPVHDDAASTRPTLRGLDVDRHAARRLPVVLEASGLPVAQVRALHRQFERLGYACHLLRFCAPRNLGEHGDADLDALFPHRVHVVETEAEPSRPWYRRLESALRKALLRVRATDNNAVVTCKESWACPACLEAVPGAATWTGQRWQHACGHALTPSGITEADLTDVWRAPLAEQYDGRDGPRFKTLKANKVPLTPEERAEVMQAKAVWHYSHLGRATPAVWKAVVDGKDWYCTNTHRAYNVRPTLKGAIQRFHDFVKTTA